MAGGGMPSDAVARGFVYARVLVECPARRVRGGVGHTYGGSYPGEDSHRTWRGFLGHKGRLREEEREMWLRLVHRGAWKAIAR